MPYIPHTDQDVTEMLHTIGVSSMNDLFSEIPENLRTGILENIPAGMKAMEANRFFSALAQKDAHFLNFIGAGAYEHYIPGAVWSVASRGEFLTAYTPYQPEASQGSLQLIYEYQSMMASLMGLEVSNASMYDGASSLAEAILMAARISKHSSPTVLLPKTLHPYYREAVRTLVEVQGVTIEELNFDSNSGTIPLSEIEKYKDENITALVIPFPNFFGQLEEIDALTHFAKEHHMLVIAVMNPIAASLFKEPGVWGKHGVDIACGEGQPLGIPLASGGPYFGFLCCKKEYVRQMPGRIVGKTIDQEQRAGFVLTLQAREQHIRRAKATSNICTNQGLMVTAATIYMSLLGLDGLAEVATASHQQTQTLISMLEEIPGIRRVFTTGHYFHEILIQLPVSSKIVLKKMSECGIEAGFAVEFNYPELMDCILICATETKTHEDLMHYTKTLKNIIDHHQNFKG